MAVYPSNPVVPGHVPAELVYDYDVYAPGPPGSDFHVELHELKQRAPSGFIAKFLAESPEHRRQIIETPTVIGAAVEELLRRFPTTAVGTGRLCIQDTILGGVQIKAGDMLMTSTAMLNFDETVFPDPLRVDFDRRRKPIGTFGDGPHHCVGDGLTRMEITIFLQEWLARIPEFELAEKDVAFVPGANISHDRVALRWSLPRDQVSATDL